MVTTLAQRLEAFLSCCHEGKTILSKDDQLDVVKMHKSIRARDYVFNFDLHGANDFKRAANTTSAGWFFLITGAAVFFEDLSPAQYPRIGIKFPMLDTSSPFGSEIDKFSTVPAGLVLGREGAGDLHFEEYKNTLYVLGDTVTIEGEALNDTAVNDIRGTLVLTGLEVDIKTLGD